MYIRHMISLQGIGISIDTTSRECGDGTGLHGIDLCTAKKTPPPLPLLRSLRYNEKSEVIISLSYIEGVSQDSVIANIL